MRPLEHIFWHKTGEWLRNCSREEDDPERRRLLLVVDEAHLCPAEMFSTALNSLNAKITTAAIPPLSPDIAKGGHSMLFINNPPKDQRAPASKSNSIALLLFIAPNKIYQLNEL